MKKTELDHQITEENTAVTEQKTTKRREPLFGCMKDQIEILGDIESPIYADWVKLCSS